MAVVPVGFGGWVNANNAPVTPPLPSGLQNGDLIFAMVYVRENGATIGTSTTGWAPYVGQQTTALGENCVALYWSGSYVAGVTQAPTFTFAGGGSNDTTMACTLAIRSDTGTPIAGKITYSYSPNGNTYLAYNGGTEYCPRPDDLILVTACADNDWTTAYIDFSFPGSTATLTKNISSYNVSVLGADATCIWATGSTSKELTSVEQLGTTVWINNTAGDVITTIIRFVEALNIVFTPTGGASAGGAATTGFLPAGTYEVVADGGASVGGTIPAVETAEYGLREQQPQVTAFRKDSIGSITFSWATAALDANTLLLMCVSSNQGSVTPAGVAVPVCPAGWNEYTEIAPNSTNKLRVFWKRWTPGDASTVTVEFSGDTVAAISKSGSINFFRNTDWAFAGGNPFGTARNDAASALQSYFYLTQTSATSSTQISVKSSGSLNLQTGGTLWKVLPNAWAGSGGQTGVDVRAAYRFVAGSRSTQTQETEYLSTQFSSTYHHAHFPIATLGGAMTYDWAVSGGASAGGSADTVPPNAVTIYQWMPLGGVTGSGAATPIYQRGPTPRALFALQATWSAAAQRIGAARSVLVIRAGGAALRLRSLRINRTLEGGNRIEAIALSRFAPCAVSQQLEVGLVLLDASGATLSERLWSATVARVYELGDAADAWRIQATEQSIRGGGKAWEPAAISTRTTSSVRAAPDVYLVAGDTYRGRAITSVTTYIEAGGAGATEASYG